MARFQARFGSKCSCGARFPQGTMIEYRNGAVIGCPGCEFTGREATRPAADSVELWAMAAIVALSGLCDGARSLDGRGFSKQDSAYGKSLARGILAQAAKDAVALTDHQWHFAARMGAKYHRQVGAAGSYAAEAMRRAAGRLGIAFAPHLPETTPAPAIESTPLGTIEPEVLAAWMAENAASVIAPDPSADTVAALGALAEVEAERAAVYAALPR